MRTDSATGADIVYGIITLKILSGRYGLFTILILTLMASDWPSGLDQFGEFLRAQGLSFERHGVIPHTGEKLWQYGTSEIGVRVFADRGLVWSVQLADVAGWPGEWYPASEIKELLSGQEAASPSKRDERIKAEIKFGEESSEQDERIGGEIRFVEEHWLTIVETFSPEKREQAHSRLIELRKLRNEQRWR